MLLLASHAHASDFSREELIQRESKFRTMKTTGLILAVTGAAQVLAGAILIATSEEKRVATSPSSESVSNPQQFLGLVIGGSGLPPAIVGTVLASIGHGRSIMYRDLLDALSLRLDLNPERPGGRLTYTF